MRPECYFFFKIKNPFLCLFRHPETWCVFSSWIMLMSTMVRTTKASTRLRLTTAWCWRYIHIHTLFTCTFRLQFSFISTFTCVLMSYNELKLLCCLVWRTELITSDSGEEREGMLKLRPIIYQIFSNCHHFEDCCQNLVIVSRISLSLTVFVCVCVCLCSILRSRKSPSTSSIFAVTISEPSNDGSTVFASPR